MKQLNFSLSAIEVMMNLGDRAALTDHAVPPNQTQIVGSIRNTSHKSI